MEFKLVRNLITAVFTIAVAALAGATALVSQGPAVTPADLVLYNGKIATLETPATVQALAARGGRIVALGADADLKRYVGQGTEAIDLAGSFAMPGFIEGHGHFGGVGQSQLQLNLMKATSWDEIVAMVAAAVKQAKPGQWIYGRGWHQEKWKAVPSPNVEGFPTHESLSAV
jgi:predicted amidohydrolase YtcJ